MAEIIQTISTIPDAGKRGIQERDDFVSSQEAFQDHLVDNTVSELNAFKEQANNLRIEVNSTRDTVVEKEALINPHYSTIDSVGNNIDDIIDINDNISIISNVNNNIDNIATVNINIDNIITTSNNIENVNKVSNNINSITTATDNIDLISASTQNAQNAQDAYTNTEALASQVSALAGIDYGSFSVVDGELLVGYFDSDVVTPSIVDGEFILTY